MDGICLGFLAFTLGCWFHPLVVSAQSCVSVSPCFTYSHGPCSAEDQTHINSSSSPVHVTLLDPGTDDWQEPLYKYILILLCEGIQPEFQSENMSSPYCWSANTSTPVSCDSTCNCTAVEISILNRVNQRVISSSRVAAVLNEDQSKLSLQFAGFTIVSVRTDESTESEDDDLDLFDVPIESWVCVGLGVIVALLVLLKPVWWDRLIGALCSGKSQAETTESSAIKEDSPTLELKPPPITHTQMKKTIVDA